MNQLDVNGFPVMLRLSDSFVNGSQLLRSIEMEPHICRRILSDITSRDIRTSRTGGIWISLESAVAICKDQSVYNTLSSSYL
jgi:hypothetical protein